MTPVLRPYQIEAIASVRQKIRGGAKKIVLISPTGSGKTVMAAKMINSATNKGSRSLFLAHRTVLVDQTVDKLQQFGVTPGVIMARDPRRDDWLPVQVASVQTLVRRLDKKPEAQLVIVDECHHCMSETYKRILAAYDKAIVVGLTATPWRSDRMGLADFYDTSVLSCKPAELIRIGALVPYDAFAYDAPDLHEVKITAGEYNTHDLSVACNTTVLVGHVIDEYERHAIGRRAILFPVDIAHSKNLVSQCESRGISAEHIDCDTPPQQRKRAMERFQRGDLLVLSSVGVLTEGFDAPAAEVCILAKPTQSLTLHLQMIGRVMRPSPETGKQRALIHDHAGNVMRHGFPDDEREYSLRATPPRVKAAHTCPACYAIFGQTINGRCPSCKKLIAVPEERAKRGGVAEKEMVEGTRISREQIEKLRDRRSSLGIKRVLTDQQLARATSATREEKAAEYLRLRNVQKTKGFQDGFVGHQFRAVFSHWPKFRDEELKDAQPAQRPFFPLKERA